MISAEGHPCYDFLYGQYQCLMNQTLLRLSVGGLKIHFKLLVKHNQGFIPSHEMPREPSGHFQSIPKVMRVGDLGEVS